MNDGVLLFGGAGGLRPDTGSDAGSDTGSDTGPDPAPREDSPSTLFQRFVMWLGAVYAMEHDLAVDPDSLRRFDPVSVMPLYHRDAERGDAVSDRGLTMEQSWLAQQLLIRRPTTCVVVDRFTSQPSNRITRLRTSSAEALVDELVQRLARNFRFEGRHGWSAALEDAYFEPADLITTGVLIPGGGHAISVQSADPRSHELFYLDPWPTGTLVPGGRPGGEGRLWRIGAQALAEVIVYALVADVPAVERSADIYADSVRLEADPSTGAALDVAWHATWEVAGPTYCLVSADADVRAVQRIPYRAQLPASEIVDTVVNAYRARSSFVCVGHVRLDVDAAHSITLLRADADTVVFHDPWPTGSLLAAGQNAVGLEARQVADGWQLPTHELERCLEAVFISPEVLAELQDRVYRRTLADVLSALSFFGIHETGREPRGDVVEVHAEPGGFQDRVKIRFGVTDTDSVEGALLRVDRSWLEGPDAPFGVDIIKSFLGATVSPLDAGEASFTIRAVEALARGRDAVVESVASGPPHLVGQTRALLAVILARRESALVTHAFTRTVARNEEGWLSVGLERAGRTVGPLLVGASLPAPWGEP